MGDTIIPNPCILGGDHHSDEVTEESAVSEAAEKLLGFDLPATNTTHNENESTQIRYDTKFSQCIKIISFISVLYNLMSL